LLEYNVHYDPDEMDELNDLSPFNLKKDLKNISENERQLIAEEIANELIKGIHRPPNTIVRYWARLRNAAWVKIKTMDVGRDTGKSNGYRCVILADTINNHAFLLHVYRHGHGEDMDIDRKSENKLKKLVEEYSNSLSKK